MEIKKICVICKKEFTPVNAGQLSCGKKCRAIRNKQWLRDKWLKLRPAKAVKKCLQCGAEFETSWPINQKFCSQPECRTVRAKEYVCARLKLPEVHARKAAYQVKYRKSRSGYKVTCKARVKQLSMRKKQRETLADVYIRLLLAKGGNVRSANEFTPEEVEAKRQSVLLSRAARKTKIDRTKIVRSVLP